MADISSAAGEGGFVLNLDNINFLLQDLQIPIPEVSFDAGRISGKFDCGFFCPEVNYAADVNIEIKSGTCTRTSVSQLELNPDSTNSDTYYGISLDINDIQTDCTFTTEVVVTNAEATAVGITVGVIVDAPPLTDIGAVAVGVQANQRLSVTNNMGFSNDFLGAEMGVGACDIPLGNDNFQWGSLSLPLDFKLRIFGSEYTVHSDDFGTEVEEYLKTNTDEVVAPAVVDLLCERFTMLLESLKESLETLTLLKDAESYVDPFVGNSPPVLEPERALDPPEEVVLVDFRTNELFRTVVGVFFSVEQDAIPPAANPALQQIQDVLEDQTGDQDLLDLLGSALNLTIYRDGNTFSTDATDLMQSFVSEYLQFEGIGGMELLSLTIDGSGMELNTEDQNLVVLGGQTLQLPEIDIESVVVNMGLDLTIDLFDIATSLGLVYNGAPVTVRDDVSVTLTVTQAQALLSLFLAIDWAAIQKLPFVSIYNHPLDCALSSFYELPGIPGSTFDAIYPSVPAEFTGASDAATLLLVSTVEAVMIVYQRAFPAIISNTLLNVTSLLEPSICPGPNITDLNNLVPFDFEKSIFSLILDLDDRTIFDALFGFMFKNDEINNKMTLEILGGENNQSASTSLPTLDGIDHTMDFFVNRVALEVATPLVVNNLKLLEINEAVDGTRRQFDSFFELESISLVMDLQIGETFQNLDSGEIHETSSNLVISFDIDNLDFTLGLFLKVLKYDIESIELSQILNLGCWLATLDGMGGGITDVALTFGSINVSATCESCESSMFVDVAELLNGPDAQTIFGNLANALSEGLSASIVESFSGGNLQDLVVAAKQECETGEGSLGGNSLVGMETRERILDTVGKSFQEQILDVLAGIPGDISNPFENAFGAVSALNAENRLETEIDTLLDLTDGNVGTILVNKVFNADYPATTNSSASDPFVRTVLGIIETIANDSGGSILDTLFDLLKIESQMLSDEKHAVQLDILEMLERLGDVDSTTSSYPLYSFNVADQVVIEIAAHTAILNTEVTISTTEGLEFLGEQTVMMPPILFNDLSLDAVLSLRLVVDDVNTLVGLGGAEPVRFEVMESMVVSLNVDELHAKIAALIAIDLDALKNMELGAVIENPFDCALAVFAATPALTGVYVGAEGVDLSTGGGVIGQLGNILIAPYQVKLPDVLSLAMNSILGDSTNVPLVADTSSNCVPVAIELQNVPFDFETGLFADLKSFVGRKEVEAILPFVFSDDSEEGFASINIIKPEDPIEVAFSLPQEPGVSTPPFAAFFGLNKIALGLRKPFQLGNFSLLQVDDTERWQEYFPQGLLNTLDLRDAYLDLEIVLALGPNKTMTNETDAINQRFLVGINHTLIGEVESNRMTARLYFEDLAIAAMAWIKTSEYAVFSMPLESLTSPNCWLSILEKPGGLKSFNVTASGVSADVACDCETEYVQTLADAFRDPKGWEGLESLVNGAAKVWTTELEQEFEGTKWDEFNARAVQGCSNDTVLKFTVALEEFEATDFDAESTKQAITFTSVFVGLSGTIFFLSKRHSQRIQSNIKEACATKYESSQKNDTESEPAMFFNEKLPRWMRWSLLAAVFMNLGMFIYGDTQNSFTIGAEATLLGEPVDFGTIQEFSVISSTVTLFKSGAIYLAIMLFFLAIFWPYAKLTTMLVCLLVPPRKLKAEWRGKIIHALDFFGKYSFVEVYFVSFILTILRLSVQSPDFGFLPERVAVDLFAFDLLVLPQPSLYVFLAALVQSLILSNVMLRFHTLIEEGAEVEVQLQSDDLEKIESNSPRSAPPNPKAWGILGRALPGSFSTADDSTSKISMYGWVVEKEGTIGQLSVLGSCLCSLLSGLFVIATWCVPVMTVDMHGFAKILFELEGASVSNDVGLADLVSGLLESGTFGEFFIAFFIVFTLCIMPLLSAATHIIFVLVPMTHEQAVYFNDIRHIIQSWSAMEIFVIAVLFTAFELGHLTENIVTEEDCDIIGDALVGVLLPVGLINEEDVAVGCFKASTTLQIGIYFALVVVILLGTRNACVKPFCHFYEAEGSSLKQPRKTATSLAEMFINPVFLEVNRELSKQRRVTSFVPRGPIPATDHEASPSEGVRATSVSLDIPATAAAC